MAALFYGQAQASPEDIEKLSNLLGVSRSALQDALGGDDALDFAIPLRKRKTDDVAGAVTGKRKR